MLRSRSIIAETRVWSQALCEGFVVGSLVLGQVSSCVLRLSLVSTIPTIPPTHSFKYNCRIYLSNWQRCYIISVRHLFYGCQCYEHNSPSHWNLDTNVMSLAARRLRNACFFSWICQDFPLTYSWPHCGPGVHPSSSRNECQGYLLGRGRGGEGWRQSVRIAEYLAIFICRLSRNCGSPKCLSSCVQGPLNVSAWQQWGLGKRTVNGSSRFPNSRT